MTDSLLDALLAAYAGPDWTPGAHLVIADRLEELGDERADVIRKWGVWEHGGTWHVWNSNAFQCCMCTPQRDCAEAELRRQILALFPPVGPDPVADAIAGIRQLLDGPRKNRPHALLVGRAVWDELCRTMPDRTQEAGHAASVTLGSPWGSLHVHLSEYLPPAAVVRMSRGVMDWSEPGFLPLPPPLSGLG